jgi:F-type H+-transporting ATPase subunit a
LKTLIKSILFLLLTALFSGNSVVLANDETKTEEKSEKFNAGELIIDHISDSHDWHIAGDLHVPLPIILYVQGSGLKVFSSSNFEQGKVAYEGLAIKENHIVAVDATGKVDEEATSKIWDFSITKNTASILFIAFLMCWIFISVAKAYTRRKDLAPKGMQSLVEPLILFVRDDVAIPSIGEKKYARYMPFLLTIFFFVLMTNLLGLIPFLPGGSNVTGNIAVTLTLALFTFIITTVSGNKHYWRHIIAMPGVPAWVLVLLTPIEILGVFLRPFVLMIRLFANILAGHIIALSFFCLIFIFAEMNKGVGYSVSVVSVLFTVFMGMLELLVAFLQAYVFTLLSAIYFGAAVEEAHHPPHPDTEQQTVI